jgi:hypothetical protein
LGLVYQQDFDTFGEFLRNLFTKKKKRRIVNPLDIPPVAPANMPVPATTTTTPVKKEDED